MGNNKFDMSKYESRKLEVLIMATKFEWKKVLLGLKRPLIALIAMGLASLAGVDGWQWLATAGISAERVWSTVEFYLTK